VGDRASIEKFVGVRRGVAIAQRPGKKDQKKIDRPRKSTLLGSHPQQQQLSPLTSIGLPPPESPKPHNSPKVFATGVSQSPSSQV